MYVVPLLTTVAITGAVEEPELRSKFVITPLVEICGLADAAEAARAVDDMPRTASTKRANTLLFAPIFDLDCTC